MEYKEYEIVSNFGTGNNTVWKTINELDEFLLINNDNVQINFLRFKENNPFNMLIIAHTIKKYSNKNNINFIPQTYNSYLDHVGFYDACGFKYGKKIGEAVSNNNYVPIRTINFSSFKSVYDEIVSEAEQLANVLSFDENLTKFTKYVFIELIRNVFEHAEINQLMICAQKWPNHNLVEIAIVDGGIGIVESLRKRRKIDDELECLKMAILPGVSSMSNHNLLDEQDPWQNSGYGLYIIDELCKSYNGNIIIASGNFAIYDYKEFRRIKKLINFHGTGICVRFSTNKPINFNEELSRIVKKGQLISRRLKDTIKKASKSSSGNY